MTYDHILPPAPSPPRRPSSFSPLTLVGLMVTSSSWLLILSGLTSNVADGFSTSSVTTVRTKLPLRSRPMFGVSVGTTSTGKSIETYTTSFRRSKPAVGRPAPRKVERDPSRPLVGILLLNLGGPTTTDEVEPFLYNLFADPDIIRLPGPLSPLQPTIASAIARTRAPKSIAAYESIGGGSPILDWTGRQGDGIVQKLEENYGIQATWRVGMRYWRPYTSESLLELVEDEACDCIVVLPLYPQFSISTSGSSLRVLQEEMAVLGADAPVLHTTVASYHTRPGYIAAQSGLIREQLDAFDNEEPRHVLFSAHGVPASYIAAGDPYQEQIQECVDAIGKTLPDDVTVHLSYQSRVGPIEWLRPYTDDKLVELGEEMGVKNLVVVPISFVSEHIETLEEMDMEYKEVAEEAGITNWKRCPALNTSPAFLSDMADLIAESLSGPTQSVSEACVANNVNLDVSGDATGSTSSGGSTGRRPEVDLNGIMGMKDVERINGQFAMVGVVGTVLWEALSGKGLLHMFGL